MGRGHPHVQKTIFVLMATAKMGLASVRHLGWARLATYHPLWSLCQVHTLCMTAPMMAIGHKLLARTPHISTRSRKSLPNEAVRTYVQTSCCMLVRLLV